MSEIRRDIGASDVQAVDGLAALQQFAVKLGYDAREVVDQTAASLGVAEAAHSRIRHASRVVAERIAPGSPPALEFYCFEVASLTADVRKAVVAAFRNKPGNQVLIVTTRDYDPLEFVLVEKGFAPTGTKSFRPTTTFWLFSVDRRHPSRVHLRVLERMRRTAADPYAQFERIRDAFRLAEWSEDEFNNRGLFSDYFLKTRLPDERTFPVWNTDLRPTHRDLLRVFEQAGDVRPLGTGDFIA